jgi:uncharacterized LabA/DUF88 family protein
MQCVIKINTVLRYSFQEILTFLALIKYLRRSGKKIYVFSSKNNVSEELRTSADGYCDVLTINEETDNIWSRELKRRPK